MQVPILQTRLKPPVLPENLISRQELMDKMSHMSLAHKLTLVSAPAGYGKTTLAVQWLKKRECSHIWLSLDEIHRDSRMFMQYILSALSSKYPIFNSPFWQIPQQKQQWEPLYLLGHLINQIDRMEMDFTLVLDDYQIIESEEHNRIVEFLLDNLPSRINILMLSRTVPQLALASLRGKGELIEIYSRDLQVSQSQIESLINQTNLLSLPEEEVLRICELNEGWITGIQLALRAKAENSPSHRVHIGAFLLEEMIEREEERLVSFLCKTSILTYLNASLCDSLLPELGGKSHEILRELQQKNLFIQAVDMDGEWFRIHALLREILIEKRSHSVEELHIRAAQWFWMREQYGESLYHYTESGNYPLAIKHLLLCRPLMERNFNSFLWLKWTKAIPEEEKSQHPFLLCQIASAQLEIGQLRSCELTLSRLEKRHDSKEWDDSLWIQIFSTRSYLSFVKRDLAGTKEYADKMAKLIGGEDSYSLVQARSFKALSLWLEGHLDQAFQIFTDFRDEMAASGVPAFALGSYLALIQIRNEQGRSRDALELYKEAIQWRRETEESVDKVEASLHLRGAAIYFEQGDMNSMEKCLALSEELGRSDSLVDYPYQFHQFKAVIYESQGKWDRALAELNEAEHLFVPTPAMDEMTIDEQRLRILIGMKKKTTAKKNLNELLKGRDYLPSFQFESRLMIKVRYSLVFDRDTREIGTALELLNRLSDVATAEKRLKSQLEISYLKIGALYKLNKKKDAQDVMVDLLNQIEQGGYIQILSFKLEYFEPIFKEFSQSLSHITAYQRVADFIQKDRSATGILSARELEVLKLMASGLSNRSIGEKMFVAESTIKGHNQRIFQKLNVTKRTEAIAQGRKIGLIG